MRLIKGFIIGLIVLFFLLVLMGLLMPSQTIVSRAIDLPAPPSTVLPWLSSVNRWPAWMEGLDSTQMKTINDSVTQIGKMEVVMLVNSDTLIQTRWTSADGIPHLSTMRLLPADQGKLCTVQWQFEQKVGWLPWERLGTMMHEKIMGPQLENNLERLRQQIIAPQ
jgi:hypothetical protein